MLRWVISLILLIGISVTQGQSQNTVGPDGYKFLTKQYTRTNVKVRVVVHPNRASLQRAADKVGLNAGTLSFTNVNNPKECVVHIVDPSYTYEPEIVGHEFLHCMYGQWHIKNR